jgi:gas vesicle protein
MAGFRRSTWFAVGLMIGGLVGVALGLMLALQPAEGEASQGETPGGVT